MTRQQQQPHTLHDAPAEHKPGTYNIRVTKQHQNPHRLCAHAPSAMTPKQPARLQAAQTPDSLHAAPSLASLGSARRGMHITAYPQHLQGATSLHLHAQARWRGPATRATLCSCMGARPR